MGAQLSHQAKWKKSVFQVYKEASIPWEWTPILKAECDRAGIHYFSSPYDFGAVDMLDPYVPAYKIGSGDITWPEMLEKIASKGKPTLIAAGASTMEDVRRAMAVLRKSGVPLGLMQCNTNYTASLENFRHIHLRVLPTFAAEFPEAVLGLSDHTPGHATVLGAVTLGARMVEKHFTDDTRREGPDHPFSMTPATWRDMVDRTRELELALGSPTKEVAANERDTIVVQRRCLRAVSALPAGTVLCAEHLEALRPSPPESIKPYELAQVIGRKLRSALTAGQHLARTDLESP
jgi:sialic acid synthase SpsE